MNLSYEYIQSEFLLRITEYEYCTNPEEITQEDIVELMHSSVRLRRVREKFSELRFDDDKKELIFEVKNSVDPDHDMDFLLDVLTIGMTIRWLTPQVNSVELTKQFFGGKDEKWFSQHNHLREVRELLKENKLELSRTLRDHGYMHNSYIGEA